MQYEFYVYIYEVGGWTLTICMVFSRSPSLRVNQFQETEPISVANSLKMAIPVAQGPIIPSDSHSGEEISFLFLPN